MEDFAPRLKCVDDVASTTTGVAIGAIVAALIATAPRNKVLAVHVLIAIAGIVGLSWKHQREDVGCGCKG